MLLNPVISNFFKYFFAHSFLEFNFYKFTIRSMTTKMLLEILLAMTNYINILFRSNVLKRINIPWIWYSIYKLNAQFQQKKKNNSNAQFWIKYNMNCIFAYDYISHPIQFWSSFTSVLPRNQNYGSKKNI